MKAIIYLRISQDRTDERAAVDRQREDCLKRAAERGWEVVGVHEDNDISAAGKKHRQGFEAMLKAVEAGSAGVVVAWSLDRLQRNRRDELRLYELCQSKGASLSLVKGPDVDFSTAAGRLVADQLGSVARFEIEQKSERQERAAEQAAKQGRWVGGRRPFGYEPDGITVRPAEAAAIVKAYDSVLYGASLREVARTWNSQGFTTGQKRFKAGHEGEPSLWRADSVRVVLMNSRNIGKRVYKGEIVSDAEWPAIVSEERFAAVVAMLKNPARVSGKTGGRYLLSGLARCGVCGAPVHAGGTSRPGVRAYRCTASMGHFARRAEPVEEYVEAVVVGILSRPDAARLMQDDNRPDAEELRAQAVGLREQLDADAVDLANDLMSRSQFRALSAQRRAKLAAIDAMLADAGRVDVLGPLIGAENVRKVWDSLSMSRKRAVISVLMDAVIIHPPGRGTRNFNPATVEFKPKEDMGNGD
ncbi:recombinase family protein [Arthrobacter sp. FW306-04-A]|nr:recombinase family protein [Arthrobacter sp. FW306-04-A]